MPGGLGINGTYIFGRQYLQQHRMRSSHLTVSHGLKHPLCPSPWQFEFDMHVRRT